MSVLWVNAYHFVTAFAFEFGILRLVLELGLPLNFHFHGLEGSLIRRLTLELGFRFLLIQLLSREKLLTCTNQIAVLLGRVLLLVRALALELRILGLVLVCRLLLHFDFLGLETLLVFGLRIEWRLGFGS